MLALLSAIGSLLSFRVRSRLTLELELVALGIVTLALVSHLGPLPEPAKSLEMLQRHEAKRSELGVNPANVTMPFTG